MIKTKNKTKKIATNIPYELLLNATTMSGLNQTQAIVAGLKELIKKHKLKMLAQLEGKIDVKYDIDKIRRRAS
jgi:hypothetical protein